MSIFYSAGDQNSKEYFITYNRRLELYCIIENIENDADEVVKMKEDMNMSLKSFLEENTLSFYHLLNFEQLTFAEFDKNREITNIDQAMSKKRFEELTEDAKLIEKMLYKTPLTIKIIRYKQA